MKQGARGGQLRPRDCCGFCDRSFSVGGCVWRLEEGATREAGVRGCCVAPAETNVVRCLVEVGAASEQLSMFESHVRCAVLKHVVSLAMVSSSVLRRPVHRKYMCAVRCDRSSAFGFETKRNDIAQSQHHYRRCVSQSLCKVINRLMSSACAGRFGNLQRNGQHREKQSECHPRTCTPDDVQN
jgi:hypothetical protein